MIRSPGAHFQNEEIKVPSGVSVCTKKAHSQKKGVLIYILLTLQDRWRTGRDKNDFLSPTGLCCVTGNDQRKIKANMFTAPKSQGNMNDKGELEG